MKLIVGLGNPGSEYTKTRHNAGFMVLDVLAQRHAGGAVARARFQSATVEAMVGGTKCLLAKPTTFMNLSGRSVGEALRFYKLDPATDLLVITDDVALDAGVIRLRSAGGAGGHNGLKDIERMLGTDAYARLRVGVGAPPAPVSQVDWVLGRFSEDEMVSVAPALDRAADAAATWASEGIDTAMNRFNAKAGGGGFKKAGTAEEPSTAGDSRPGPAAK